MSIFHSRSGSAVMMPMRPVIFHDPIKMLLPNLAAYKEQQAERKALEILTRQNLASTIDQCRCSMAQIEFNHDLNRLIK